MNDHFDQLVNYIKQHLGQGVPEDHIRQALHQHNWNPEMVNKAFASLDAPAATTVTPQAPSTPDMAQPVQTAHAKYKVFQAIADGFTAIKHNLRTFVLALLSSYAIAFVAAIALAAVVSAVLLGGLLEPGLGVGVIMTLLIGTLVFYTAGFAFIGAFVLAASSLALHGEQGTPMRLGEILKTAVQKTLRIALVNALYGVMVFWVPIIFMYAPTLLLLLGGESVYSNPGSILIGMVSTALGIVWLIVAVMRLVLMPYVALYEPNVSVFKTIKRSSHLMVKGGQWFLFKAALLVFAVALVFGGFSAIGGDTQALAGNIVLQLALIVVAIMSNVVLVMLYRNRKAVRG